VHYTQHPCTAMSLTQGDARRPGMDAGPEISDLSVTLPHRPRTVRLRLQGGQRDRDIFPLGGGG
jgi:hypothetical protein